MARNLIKEVHNTKRVCQENPIFCQRLFFVQRDGRWSESIQALILNLPESAPFRSILQVAKVWKYSLLRGWLQNTLQLSLRLYHWEKEGLGVGDYGGTAPILSWSVIIFIYLWYLGDGEVEGGRGEAEGYLIFVSNAGNAVSVNFLAECKKIPEKRENYCFDGLRLS